MDNTTTPSTGGLFGTGCVFEVGSLSAALGRVPDHRKRRGVRYSLGTALTLITLAKLAGEDQPSGIAAWACWRAEWLVAALGLKRPELPHRTTYGRIVAKLEALKFYSERVISGTVRTLNEAPSPLAGIQALLDDMIAGVDNPNGALGCFMVNSVAELVPYDLEVTALATAYSDSLQGLLAKALTRARRPDQATRQQTPEQLAAYVFNMIQGLRVLIKSGATREQVQAIRDITLKSLQP